MNPNNPIEMTEFAVQLRTLARTAQLNKNDKNIILGLIVSTSFLDVMHEVALNGDFSANLLEFTDSSVIVFTGEDESTSTWKIHDLCPEYDPYSQVYNLKTFVHYQSFQMALAEVFPMPFEVIVRDKCIEVKW